MGRNKNKKRDEPPRAPSSSTSFPDVDAALARLSSPSALQRRKLDSLRHSVQDEVASVYDHIKRGSTPVLLKGLLSRATDALADADKVTAELIDTVDGDTVKEERRQQRELFILVEEAKASVDQYFHLWHDEAAISVTSRAQSHRQQQLRLQQLDVLERRAAETRHAADAAADALRELQLSPARSYATRSVCSSSDETERSSSSYQVPRRVNMMQMDSESHQRSLYKEEHSSYGHHGSASTYMEKVSDWQRTQKEEEHRHYRYRPSSVIGVPVGSPPVHHQPVQPSSAPPGSMSHFGPSLSHLSHEEEPRHDWHVPTSAALVHPGHSYHVHDPPGPPYFKEEYLHPSHHATGTPSSTPVFPTAFSRPPAPPLHYGPVGGRHPHHMDPAAAPFVLAAPRPLRPSTVADVRHDLAPDEWIDIYLDNREDSSGWSRRIRSSVQSEMEEFSGRAMDWFRWSDLFFVLVHQSGLSTGEKLPILLRKLKGDARDLVYGLGGGEDAYKEALRRLKQAYGRRDVMREAHKQALDKLDYSKGDPASFKRYAEKIRTHLFDLNRLTGVCTEDIIGKICLKLEPVDCIAWTSTHRPEDPLYSLNQFGSWLCDRASGYLNPITLAATQDRGNIQRGKPRQQQQQGRAHKTSGDVEKENDDPVWREPDRASSERKAPPKRPANFCCKCEKPGHLLPDCKSFKEMKQLDRFEFVTRHRLCYLCLQSGHTTRSCSTGKGCGTKDCKFKHHLLLHDSSSTSPAATPTKEVKGSTSSCSFNQSSKKVAVGVLNIDVVAADERVIESNLMYDECSDITLIREAFLRRLGIKGSKCMLSITGVGGIQSRYHSEAVIITILDPDGNRVELRGYSVPHVANAVPFTDWSQLKHKWSHLSDLPLRGSGGTIDILLGCDYARKMAALESRVGSVNEPVAARTDLGWIARGVIGVGHKKSTARTHTIFSSIQPFADLDEEFRRFCNTESFGTEFAGDGRSIEDNRVIKSVEESTEKLPGGGYRVRLAWKEGEPSLPENMQLAEHRLRGLHKRFERDPEFEEEYRSTMQRYFEKGYARKLTKEEAATGPSFYLPHHGVYKKTIYGSSKKKLRVVFDSAARYRGKCLNDGLLAGPKLQNQLPGVLIKFRLGDVAFSSDIEAMFCQIRLYPEDAKLHRFLWQEKGSTTVDVCQMDRLTFGDCCSPYIAIATTHRAAYDAGKERPEAVAAIRNNLYVDDYLDSARTVVEAVQRAKDVKEILSSGEFHLRSWVSNHPEFNRMMATEPDSQADASASSCPLGSESAEAKVLGVYWRPEEDVLTFAVGAIEDIAYTRVGLVSKVAGVYDPLGLVAPLVVKAKIKIRELSIRGLQWHDDVTEEDRIWWNLWFDALRRLSSFSIPRCIFPDEEAIISTELHTFSDASEEAFAASVYLRHLYTNGRIEIRFVIGKTKLAPKKTISVAKLELNAALLGSRLATFAVTAIDRPGIQKKYWTDSSCVRNWVRASSSYYKPFVSHRIGEIQTLTDTTEWRFVPGKLNCSDAATRSLLEPDEEIPSSYKYGPDFLKLKEKDWPKDLPWMTVPDESRSAAVLHIAKEFDWTTVIIDPAQLTSLTRLEPEFIALILQCQEESFADDIIRLKEGKPVRYSSSLLSLTPQVGADGLLRLGGRIGKASLPYDNLHPVLLPPKHPLTKKIIIAFHQHLHHAGTEFLLSHIQQHFWIIRGREAVKKIRRECIQCQKETAKPAVQLMGELLADRLDYCTPPFTHTAVDYFGPLEIGYGRNKTAKRYGALFTCLVTRAVYLDLSQSLSTDDFLLVLRRFISCHRKPVTVHSDNGTNFIGAERELIEAVQQLNQSKDLKDFTTEKGINWKFQPPSAPHFGGAHESLVRSTKKALYRALEVEGLQGRLPTDEIMRTILYEVAGLLNARPLTYVSCDPDDYRPLTPNDFMNKPSTADVPIGDFEGVHPRQAYRYSQRFINLFWDLWKTRYLQSQATRAKWSSKQRNFAIGDVVLVIDPNLKRGKWEMGRVIETFPGTDGLVRVVRVNTDRGDYLRPIHRLCLLYPKEEPERPVPVTTASGEDVPAE